VPELTAAQLASRADGMGASDVVEAANLAPWEGAGSWRLYNAKLGITPPSPPTEEMKWGHSLERVIATWYVDNVGPFAIPGDSHFHSDEPWLWATLDGITPDRTIEIKNVGGFMCRDWSVGDPDGVPDYVRAQVQIGMLCAVREECHVVASLAGRPPELWTVRYDAELAGILLDKARKFWRCVQERIDPPLDGSDACREYLRHKYPRDERPMLTPPPGIYQIAGERNAAAQLAKSNAAIVKELDARLMAGLEDAAGWDGEGWKFTWKRQKDGKRATRFTWKGGEE
jgi:putative phage-type endonuclease